MPKKINHPGPAPFLDAGELDRFFAELARRGNVTAASALVGVAPRTMHAWRNNDDAVAERWAEAVATVGDVIETEAIRRGVFGYYEEIYDAAGKLVGRKKVYSDRLIEVLLRGAKPEKYGGGLSATDPDGNPLNLTWTGLVRAGHDQQQKATAVSAKNRRALRAPVG